MNTLTDRGKWDIQKISGDKDYYCTLPERHKTAAVSMAAVSVSGQNLEYVPETVIDRKICRTALEAKDSDCSILPYIPYPDVQKEGIQRFLSNTPAFVLYSFVDISDIKMALEAVKADAYCLQLVPSELLTKDLCKTALISPNADEKVSQFVMERFPDLKMERTQNICLKMK